MIRLILAVLWVVIFLIVSIPIFIIELIIGLFSKKARAISSQACVSFAFKGVLFFAGTKVIVKGKEKLPKDEAVLLTPNHRSIFDIVITYPLSGKMTAFISKKSIKKVPLLSTWMQLMECQFLDRSDLRAGLKVILDSAELIKKGHNIVVFPEGTRNKADSGLLPFRDGCLKISEKSECPIVPIAINNTEQILEAHMPKIKKTTVVIEFCDPIITKGLSREERKGISKMVQDEIIEAYERNKELIK